MSIHEIEIDLEKGFDVVNGKGKVVAHYDTHEEAVMKARENAGRYVRYFEKKPTEDAKCSENAKQAKAA